MKRVDFWLIAGAAVLLGEAAHAQPVADYFRGKTVNMLIGYTSGGGYDIYARVLSKHLGRHIPGHPSVVPQNSVIGCLARQPAGQSIARGIEPGWNVNRRAFRIIQNGSHGKQALDDC